MSVIAMPSVRPIRCLGALPRARAQASRLQRTLRGLVVDPDGRLASRAASVQTVSARCTMRWLQSANTGDAIEAMRCMRVDVVVVALQSQAKLDLQALCEAAPEHALIVVVGDPALPQCAEEALEHRAVEWFLPLGPRLETQLRELLTTLSASSRQKN